MSKTKEALPFEATRFDVEQEPVKHENLVAALIAAQKQFSPAFKNAVNPHFGNRFVDLQGAWDACREALWANGLTVLQYGGVQDSVAVLFTELAHESGQSRTGAYPLVTGKPNDPQALGASMTYARRYCLMAMLGMAPEDDDGNAASSRNGGSEEATIGPGQMKKLEDLLGATGTDSAGFLTIFGVDRLGALTVSQFTPAVNLLEKKKAAVKA